MEYEVVILGSDANAYYMARCAYEYTRIKPTVFTTKPLWFTEYSNILKLRRYDNMWDELIFLKNLNDYAKESIYNKILLVSTNETYTEFLSKNKGKINKKYYYNYIDYDLLTTLTNKEKFYKTYDKSNLLFPKTIYYDLKKDNKKIINIGFPLIMKPANVVMWNHLEFKGKNKIYKLNSKKELNECLSIIKKSGYDDLIIIQEFIPGGDDSLFDSVLYVDKKHKVKRISFAQIGLQERTNTMVGNAAVLINGFNTTSGNSDEMMEDIVKFFESINYSGFAEVDMKYDIRDNKFKVLEINARQGRCSYYISKIGCNLIEMMVKDLIYNENLEYFKLDKKYLLSFVPRGIIKRYINNDLYLDEAFRLYNNKESVNPLIFKEDKSLKRFIMIKRRLINYYKEYKNSYWR